MSGRLTIVGPEPGNNKPSIQARVNIEALMLMAKYDDSFKDLLLSDRERALAESGISFSKSELIMLRAISGEKLEKNIDEFVISGVTKESLPSWKEAAAVVLLVMGVILSAACATAPKDPAELGWKVHNSVKRGSCDINTLATGWCDEDTYRKRAVAEANPKYTDLQKRKDEARKAAILIAQYDILDYFKGFKVEGATGIFADYQSSGLAIAYEIKDFIKHGEVIAERWNESESGSYEILYEVRAKKLKKMVDTADWYEANK